MSKRSILWILILLSILMLVVMLMHNNNFEKQIYNDIKTIDLSLNIHRIHDPDRSFESYNLLINVDGNLPSAENRLIIYINPLSKITGWNNNPDISYLFAADGKYEFLLQPKFTGEITLQIQKPEKDKGNLNVYALIETRYKKLFEGENILKSKTFGANRAE